ncbi:hypothetical protein JCM12298_01960 [Desulfothermus naphthae]
MNNNVTNLDKTCAEFGIDLLEFFKKTYEKINELIKSCRNLSDLRTKSYKENGGENKKLEEFGNYSLGIIKDSLKNDNDFNKLKKKDKPLNFDSKSFETEITKALGILVEDGPFAYLIWLKSEDKEPHRAMLIQTARILQKLKLMEIDTSDDLKEKIEFSFLNEITSDLTKTLFTKTILEKMLIYARYKAKAIQHE